MADGYAVTSWAAEPGGARRELAGLGSRFMGFAETRLAPGEAEEIAALEDVEQMHLVVAGRARIAGLEAAWLDAVAIPLGTPCTIEAIGADGCRVITMSASYGGREPERTEVRLAGWDDLRDNQKLPAPDGYRHPWPTWEPYVSRDYDGVIGTETLSFVVNRIRPGQSGQHHRHAQAEEIAYLLRGRCRMKVGDDELEVREGEAVLAEAPLLRSFFNDSDAECLWLVVGAPVDEFYEPGLVSYHAANRWA